MQVSLGVFIFRSWNQCRISATRNVIPTIDPKKIQPAPITIPNQENILLIFVPPVFLISLSARIPVIKVAITARLRRGKITPSVILMTSSAVPAELYTANGMTINKMAVIPLMKLITARRFVLSGYSNFSPNSVFHIEIVNGDLIIYLSAGF